MSDFYEVLERLLADPEFQTALRRDPESALAGYHLAPDERQLLDAQLDLSPGEERTVEMRVSKSGVMGMVGPVFSALGMAASSGGGMLPRGGGGAGGSRRRSARSTTRRVSSARFSRPARTRASWRPTTTPGSTPTATATGIR